MMTKTNFIFDMETIGANVIVCPVVDMAYTTFVWQRFLDKPYTFEELVDNVKTVKLSVMNQMKNYNCSFKKEDVGNGGKSFLSMPEMKSRHQAPT